MNVKRLAAIAGFFSIILAAETGDSGAVLPAGAIAPSLGVLAASTGGPALPLPGGGGGAPAAGAAEARAAAPARLPSFPGLYRTAAGLALPPSGASLGALPPDGPAPSIPLLANNQVLAFYGHPNSRRMGILGEYSKEDLARLLEGYARLYDEANGETGVVPAFYLIYGTCWPEGEIGYLRESKVIEYIEYAASRGMIVFIDHQIGKYGVEVAMERILPFVRYPNVHLALDPEWRTTLPMVEIGSITAEELNLAQSMLSRRLAAEGLPGSRMLVVHQFKEKMIAGRDRVRADWPGVQLVHVADGFGPPALKRNAYGANARAANMPLKGFKLFFKTSTPGAGWDEPLLTPLEVNSLEPRPALVIYQ